MKPGKQFLALWREGSSVKMIDQRKLPHLYEVATFESHRETAKAIKEMVTRGAGCVGNAAAFAMAQAALEARDKPPTEFQAYLKEASETIKATRPTAVNLFKAVDRCLAAVDGVSVAERVERVVAEADKVFLEDIEASRAIAKHGAALIEEGARVLTHCNAGALAYVDRGTALAPIYQAFEDGLSVFVWVDETRPRNQGARLTSWELGQQGVPHTVIVDNAAGFFMQRGEVDLVLVGADRITSNGDVVNKIGTYEKALAAHDNRIPFWVAAPLMSFDFETPAGTCVEIEERPAEEVSHVWGRGEGGWTSVRVVSQGATVRNPAFDVTPARLVSGFITEYGLVKPPFRENLKKLSRLG